MNRALQMARDAATELREQNRLIIEARNVIAEAQSRINIVLAKIETYLAIVEDISPTDEPGR